MSFSTMLAKSEPYRGTLSVPQLIVHNPSPPSRSYTFDRHVTQESTFGGGNSRGKGKMPQAVSLAWDERGSWGVDMAPTSWLGMTTRERKETLLQIFLANSWASSCIDAIGLYIISGGFTIEPNRGVSNPDKAQYKKIEELLMRINDDWDFNQYIYDQITDERIFGESFTEFTMNGGLPYQLFPLDCITMDTNFDRYGRITEFKQQLAHTTQINYCDPKTIIRWWNPHKRAKVDPFSPLERMQDAIWLDKQMINWATTFFRKGGKFPYYFEGLADQDEADRYLRWFEQNYTGAKNAHTIPATWGETKIVPLGNDGPIDMSFDKGLDRTQSIVLATLHVPPAIACISETGNRLTDMSDSQLKIMEHLTCDPIKKRFFEKFNYRLIRPFYGTDWVVSSRYADLRSGESVAKVQDVRVRNGTRTIDEMRQEDGREAYKDGSGAIPIIITTKEVTPVPRLADLADEQRQTAQAALDTANANADMAQTKAKQAKEQPQQVQQQGVPPNGQDKPTTQTSKGKVSKDDQETESQGSTAIDGHNHFSSISRKNKEDIRRLLFEEGQRRGVLCLTE